MTLATRTKRWQIDRASRLHDAFRKAELRMQTENIPLQKALKQILALLQGTIITTGTRTKVLKISFGMLRANWYKWVKAGKTPESILCGYNCGRTAENTRLPAELIQEYHRRQTLPGMANITVVYKSFVQDWKSGKRIPGLGTSSEWSKKVGCNVTLPPPAQGISPDPSYPSDRSHSLPDFPFSLSSFYKYKPTKQERALGNRGFAALKAASPYISLNYSRLRKCELFVLDDVRLDVLVIDESTGRPIELKAYIMMEAASRFIPGYVLKPAEAIRQEDVDELIAHTLDVTGIGRDYTTHIKLERGTVAMSDAAQTLLEAITNGRIKIHRTGMDGGVRWVGSHNDKRSGHWMGKAVIESFMRKLHLALMTLPGQRGNKHENQPANLGLEAINSAPTKGSLLDESTKLAQLQVLLDSSLSYGQSGTDRGQGDGGRMKLHLPMLYLFQFETAFKQAIAKHNTDPGHDYQGHGTYFEEEIAPNTWRERGDA